jgi:hypothetical protein
MSAKGRGRHEGGDEDYYPTAAWPVHRLLDDCGDRLLDVRTALEPTCGDGAIIRSVESWTKDPAHWEPAVAEAPRWTGVELRSNALADPRPESLIEHHEGVDFRRWAEDAEAAGRTFGLVLGNPPFNLAEEIIRASMKVSDVVAMLLRVGFLGSDERVDFFRGVGANPALRVLPDRPSFTADGKTDSSTYAWFVWGHPLIAGNFILGSTSLAERKSQTPQGVEAALRQGRLSW